jgi:hypothetical protein
MMTHALEEFIAVSRGPGTRIGLSTRGHDHRRTADKATRLQTDLPVAEPGLHAPDTSRVAHLDATSHEKQTQSLNDVLRLVCHREYPATPLGLDLQAGFGEESHKVFRKERIESWIEEPAGRAEGLDELAD